MICPFCKNDEDKVIDSRTNGTSIRRRRECLSCGKRFTTYEYVEKTPLTVIKKDGRREEFSREKLVQGIVFSCKKRPVSMETINGVVNSIENQLFALCVQEVSYSQIGNLVMQELQKIDQVAYVRFASVYKHFEEVQEFVDQVLSLNDLKKS